MCGICGVVGGEPGREAGRVRAMTRALAHRGPDDEGFLDDEGAVLGSRRLTVIDLDGGRQPIPNEDGTLWIVFNGEVYNYRALRRELEAAGHRFRTRTDTEVVLHLYEERGPDSLHSLRGMFAFAVWDRRLRRLFAARDRFGQKPFFHAEREGRLLFASEIKALLAHGDLPREAEPVAVDHYLAQRFVPPPLTMFRGIRKLPAGHWLEWSEGSARVQPWWSPVFRPGAPRPHRDWVAELESRVDEAVGAHLVSDVPVGAFLSGGLDSSVVVASMVRQTGEPPETFCVGSDDPGFDERPFARQVAEPLGTRHHEREVSAELLGSVGALVRCLDEPSDPIAACMFEASRLASGRVKVVLGGDGGDELFGGFDRYAAFGWAEAYGRVPGWLRKGVVRPLVRAVPESFGYKSLTQKARWLDALGGQSGGRLYAAMTGFFRFGPAERALLYGPEMRRLLDGADAEAAIADPFRAGDEETPLARMIRTDMLTRLPEHTLVLTDRTSMAHGLETRAPLLDHELAEFCGSMPDSLRVRGGRTKVALRQAFRGRLPESILRRSKQGFMFPVAQWLRPAALTRVRRQLLEGPLVRRGWVEPDAVERLAVEHAGRRVDHHVRIWMLLNLDAWHRIYLDGDAGWGQEESGEAAAAAVSNPEAHGLLGSRPT